MKIYKKNHHSLFIKPFGIANKLYLTLTVFIYFDLTNPDEPLTEQELWKTIPEQLKPMPVLDAGMAKPHGEVLINGSCFAPKGSTRQASMVSVSVGKMKKELDVFGDRYWKKTIAGVTSITEPVPFSEMPITWNNAFGGKEFADNPAGKGIDPVVTLKGDVLVPLPNIEYPHMLISSPSDRPSPAGFGPLDIMMPTRQKKTGTYDDKWLKERWPYFPDDMDYEFFNCAPEDQYLKGFFTGSEKIEIVNMNPDMQLISSHMPRLRIRCFVTKKELPKSKGEIFQDVPTHIDTLSLFPSILRGVAIYRGTTEIFDEEYEDVSRILIATERATDTPGTLEYYLEQQKKAMDLTVPVNTEPLQKASKKIGDMMKRIKKIPKDIEDSIKMATGKAPVMPRSPNETAATGEKVIADSLALLDKLEEQSRGFQKQYGHLMKIDLSMFDRMRGNLLKQSARIDESLARLETAVAAAKKEVEVALKSGANKMREVFPADILDKAGFNPEALLKFKKTVNLWHDRGFPFVIQCRRNLEADRETTDMLHKLGIEQRAIKKAWLGVNHEEFKEGKDLWGIAHKDGEAGDIIVPAGLVMPRFNEAVLNRILILPTGWEKGGPIVEMHIVENSDKTPLLYLCEDGAPVVAVADELQALFLEQEIGDACSIVALAGPYEKPSKKTEEQIKASGMFLVVLPEESSIVKKEYILWKKTYPDAILRPLPKGRTLFEAHKYGIDIRKWIMDLMPDDFVRRHKIAPEIPEAGKPPTKEGLNVPIPDIDIKGIIDKSSRDIRTYLGVKTSNIAVEGQKIKDALFANVRDSIKKAGLNPNEVLKIPDATKPVSFIEAGDMMVAKLIEYKGFLSQKRQLTPDFEGRIDNWISDIKKMSQEGQARFDRGMVKLEDAKKIIASKMEDVKDQKMPDEAKAKFLKHGIDPDRMVKRTREEVIDMHGRGETLAFSILSGIDLSGLDLSGADFSQAQCIKTNFAGAILDRANFSQVMANEADFNGCSMRRITLDRTMLLKAKLKKADLSEASMKQAIFKEADLTEADLTGAILELSMIMNTLMVKARLNNIKANLTVFSDADATGIIFKEARLERCLLRRLILNKADFSYTAFPSTTFMEVTGDGVIFYGADMHKGRMSNNSQFRGADLRSVTLTLGSLRDTDLSNSDFTGTKLDGALIEKCNLREAKMSGISAKTCRFSKSDLEGADMRHINLFGGSLRKSRLVNTDLSGSNLYAVDFYKAVFGETIMHGANVKQSILARRTGILKSDKGIA